VRLSPENAAKLRPEMTTQCQIVVRVKPDVLTVPSAAVKWVDNDRTVFVVEDGKVVPVKPELGVAGLTETEVVSGLSAGQTVATQIVLPGAPRQPAPGKPAGR